MQQGSLQARLESTPVFVLKVARRHHGCQHALQLAGLFEHKLDYSRPNRFLINILTLSDRIACSLQNGIKNLYVEHYVGAIGKRANLYTMKKDVFKRIMVRLVAVA